MACGFFLDCTEACTQTNTFRVLKVLILRAALTPPKAVGHVLVVLILKVASWDFSSATSELNSGSVDPGVLSRRCDLWRLTFPTCSDFAGSPVQQRTKWSTKTIQVSLSTSLSSPSSAITPDSDVVGAVHRALSRWSTAANIKIRRSLVEGSVHQPGERRRWSKPDNDCGDNRESGYFRIAATTRRALACSTIQRQER